MSRVPSVKGVCRGDAITSFMVPISDVKRAAYSDLESVSRTISHASTSRRVDKITRYIFEKSFK